MQIFATFSVPDVLASNSSVAEYQQSSARGGGRGAVALRSMVRWRMMALVIFKRAFV